MYLEEKIEMMQKDIELLQKEVERLQKKETSEILTIKEFARRTKLNENTVYSWTREGRIKTMPNLGTAIRIPMSQFYKRTAEPVIRKTVKRTRAEQLKEDFKKSLMERTG